MFGAEIRDRPSSARPCAAQAPLADMTVLIQTP
jgi:hypothetical protein